MTTLIRQKQIFVIISGKNLPSPVIDDLSKAILGLTEGAVNLLKSQQIVQVLIYFSVSFTPCAPVQKKRKNYCQSYHLHKKYNIKSNHIWWR